MSMFQIVLIKILEISMVFLAISLIVSLISALLIRLEMRKLSIEIRDNEATLDKMQRCYNFTHAYTENLSVDDSLLVWRFYSAISDIVFPDKEQES